MHSGQGHRSVSGARVERRRATRARRFAALAGVGMLVGWASPLGAQVPSSVPSTLGGSPLVLQLRPRPGDLLRLRLDQTIEMGVSERGAEDSTAADVTSLVMLARLSVESSDASGATMLAVADSVRIEDNGGFQSDVLRQARALQGQRFRFRVAPDGSTTVAGTDAWAGPAVGSLLSQLPATLPADSIAPGATWNRSVDIPLAAAPDGRANATLTATFRFDSLSRSGEYAFISMKGRLVRSGPMQGGGGAGKTASPGEGGFVQTSGNVTATLLLDRRRGWIAEARTVISLRSLVTGRGKDTPPLRVRMKITQWMRVM
ncbi:MAG: hypothetical protein IT359_19855 [Gemmatimonadaceae bacterium]|nr:hypothetical protein [Gemmatimonadaceae bacterium]